MKKLISLFIVVLVSSQMWGAIKVNISDATGFDGITSVTGYYYTTVNSTSSGTNSITFTKGTSVQRYYSWGSDAYNSKVYVITINPKSGYAVTDFRHTSYSSVASATAVGTTKKNCYYRDGNTIYVKVYNSNNTGTSSLSVSATVASTAPPAPTTYTITYNKGSYGTGTQIAAGTKTKDVNFTLSSDTYSRTGYTQTGWCKNDYGNIKDYTLGGTYSTNADLNLYPFWTANSYTVVFNKNDNDATGTMSNQSFKYGTSQNLTSIGFTKTGYNFVGWATTANGSVAYTNSQSVNNLTATNNGTVNLYAKWAIATYTIRFFMEAGDETPIQTLQVNYNETPICTASVTKPSDTYWTYEFYGWDGNNDGVADGVSVATENKDYVAVFTKTSTGVIPPHNLTIGAATNGYVTLTPNTNSITVTVPAAGETYQYPEGTDIIVEAVPARGYHFTQWSDASTAKRRLISEIETDWSLTPTFAANTPFDMLDTWTQAQCGTEYDFDHVLTVTLVGRTFTAGQWATLSVPFDYTLTADDALYNTIYKFTNVTLSSGGSSVYLEFVRTNDIEKNEPYLVVPRQAGINEVVFDGVKLETPAAISLTTDDRVAFVSSLWQQEISGPNDFYIGKLSTLYYAPNSGMTIKGNRAFFHKITSSAPRRAIIVIDGEEREVEIADGNIEEVQNVRKYMENGVLIIERNGVRYNAQGQVAE